MRFRPTLSPILLIAAWAAAFAAPIPAQAQASGAIQTPARSVSASDAAAAAAAPATPDSGPAPVARFHNERIDLRLVSLTRSVAPGSTAVVALEQTIAPGWHTYWRNPGDSGGPTAIAWTLPAGWSAGDILWPLPQRQRLSGLVNYGYEGRVILPSPVQVPAAARPGTTATLTATVDLFVCSDQMCVPEQAMLTLDLPIRAGAAALTPGVGQAIQTAVQAAPQAAGIDGRATLNDRVLTLRFSGGPLATPPDAATPRRAWFFPDQPGWIDHAASQTLSADGAGVTVRVPAARDLIAGGLTQAISGVLATDVGAWRVEATPGSVSSGPASGSGARTLAPLDDDAGAQSEAGTDGGWSWAGLVQAAGLALIGGLLLNLMPCVLPILAMKAAALARGAHDRRAARIDGVAFTAGVLASFALLAGVLLVLRAGGQAVGWGFQLQSPPVTAVLALVMLAAGLNLAGVYAVGERLQAVGGSRWARLPGGTGAFFTGVLAVVVAAPCTAPFMAVAIGTALTAPAPLALAVFLMLGLGLALPTLAISLSGAAGRLPRPGPWMETLRRLLAFPMLGAALWLAWVFARQTQATGLAWLFAAGLALALALWLWGQGQGRGQDRQAGGPRSGRAWRIAAVVAALAALELTIMAARTSPAEAPADRVADDSRSWSRQAVDEALAEGRPVLVNFTADWCVTCQINERAALSRPAVAAAMRRGNVVYLKGDWTRRDDAIARELARHGRSGVPLYLVYRPGEARPRILPQLLSEGAVVAALERR